jgi:hypothetical protein
MKFRQVLSVVPRGMRIAALCVVSLGVLIGPIAGLIEGVVTRRGHPSAMPPGCLAAVGLGGGLVLGGFVATWLLCLGFVYGDARRRAMPAVPWMLLALFVPNLLGFLFYFVMRRPIGSPCPQCGQPMVAEQRFCSWCGYARPSSSPTTGYSGLNPTAPA